MLELCRVVRVSDLSLSWHCNIILEQELMEQLQSYGALSEVWGVEGTLQCQLPCCWLCPRARVT